MLLPAFAPGGGSVEGGHAKDQEKGREKDTEKEKANERVKPITSCWVLPMIYGHVDQASQPFPPSSLPPFLPFKADETCGS